MKQILNITKIIAVIIGTIIGAGFASGKEIYIFFAQYNNGLIGAIISAILTGIIIYSTILIVNRYNINDNNEFVKRISNNGRISIILKNIIDIFLLITFWIMSAGFCTFFKQEMGIPIIITGTINAIVVYTLLMKNIDGIIKLNLIVVPIMIAIIILISIKNHATTNILQYNQETQGAFRTIISAILYTSYNSVTLIPIIISLTSGIENKKTAKGVSTITGIILLVLIIAIYQMLRASTINVKNIEIPILAILDEYHPIEKMIYGISIITAILTSTISSGYGLLENIKDRKKYKQIAITICLLQIPISYIGFSNLVTILYPTFGVIGIAQIIMIITLALFKEKI